MQIRTATSDDLEALVPCARRSFFDAYCDTDDHAVIDEYCARHFTRERFAAILGDPGSRLFVAREGDAIAGYAQLSRSSPPSCVAGPAPFELVRLYLAKDRIGRGIGARLIGAAMDEARARGGRTIWLGVYERNERAIAFYTRFGFRFVGHTPFEWGGRWFDDPVMERAL
jgi:ribosomal protein S18 acetylase RimI-like enzyme